MSLYKDVGSRIRARRTILPMTQEELGALLHPPLTRAAISNIECGRQNVYLHTLCDIATALKMEVNDLLSVKSDLEFVESMVKEQIQHLNLNEKVGVDIMRTLTRAMIDGQQKPPKQKQRKHG